MEKRDVGFEVKEEDYPIRVKSKGYILLKYGTIRRKLSEGIVEIVNQKLDSLKENRKKEAAQ